MSISRHEIREDAREDLALQYDWYRHRVGEAIAERYLGAFRLTVDAIARQPHMGVSRRFRDKRLEGIRSLPLKGAFRVHLILYRVDGGTLTVFRVLHGMRDLTKRLLEASGT